MTNRMGLIIRVLFADGKALDHPQVKPPEPHPRGLEAPQGMGPEEEDVEAAKTES